MPSLRSRSWKSKLAAKGRRWGQKVNTAIRNHVELKTEAPCGLFCLSHCLLLSLPISLSFKLSALSQCLLQELAQKHRDGKGLWGPSCSSRLFSKGRRWSPERLSGCLKASQHVGGKQDQSTESLSIYSFI